MEDKEKKQRHIESILAIDKMGEVLGEIFKASSSEMLILLFKELSKNNAGKTFDEWSKAQNKGLKAYFNKASQIAKRNERNALNQAKTYSKDLGMDARQWKQTKAIIQEGYQHMLNTAINEHKKAVNQIKAKERIYAPSVDEPLSEAIFEHLKQNVDKGLVEYADGKKFKWENYMEMKVRTEMRKDGTEQLLKIAHDNGVVFYVASYYGDCADDHIEFNGGLFYDEKYSSMISDENKLAKIEEYIHSNKLYSVQEVVGEPYWFTTRPNCRHYFEVVDVDEVIGIIEGETSLEEIREESGLNFNGTYNAENYEALKEQRYNERQIRKYKERVDIAKEHQKTLDKDSKEFNDVQNYINKNDGNVRAWQKRQRELIKKHPDVLERDYKREKPREMMSNFGGKSKD